MRRFSFSIGMLSCALAIYWAVPACATEKIPVFVSIVPQKYFVEKIGGDLVEVSVMVEAGASPHTYEPKPQQMAALSRAKIYFAIGIEFDNVWLEKFEAINRDMLIVHTEAGIEKLPMKAHHYHEEAEHKEAQRARDKREAHERRAQHEKREGHHRQGIKDPHVWLSPPLVKVQARNILEALLMVDPDHRSVYEANYKKFIIELGDLDAEIREIFTGKGEEIEFMVFHPAWGYFAYEYGLEQVPVEIEGKEPKPAELKRLIQRAKERGIKVVFVTPQFSTRSAETVAKAIGGQIAFVDPLALDWASNLREVATKYKAALR